MARVAKKFVKWKVTLDGVEVPWQNISLKTGVDSPGQIEIVLEPDPILRYLRPGTKVHLWMYDPDVDGDDDLDRLFMFWVGDLRAPQYQRSHGSRSFIIIAEGEFASFGRSKLYAHGFGTLPNTHIVSGSTLVAPTSLTPQQIVRHTIFGKAFDPNTKNDIKDPIPFRDVKDPNYAERLLRLMAYFSSYNALFRMQSVRSNMFGKIAAFHDESLGKLLPRALVNDYYRQASTSIRPESTLLDLINQFNSMTFYHYVGIAGPTIPSTKVGDKSNEASVPVDEVSYITFPGVRAEDHLYSIPRRFLRNDYLFIPETFYAIPPSCNLIFPEFTNQFSLGRDFMAEPTRALISNTHLNAQMSVAAPDDIFRFEEEPDPAQFWSLNKDGIKLEGSAESPYHSRSTKGSPTYNLFGAISDTEIEKGIIAVTDYPSYEFFSAVANTFDLKSEDGRAEVQELLDQKDKMAADVFEGKSSRNRAFLHMMKSLADYTLVLEKFRRNVSISVVGHRWIVPGFPCVILDTTTSYIALVKGYSLNISPSGDEIGTVDLDFVRPFPQIDRRIIKKAEKAVEALAVVESEVKKLNDRMDDFLTRSANAEFEYLVASDSDDVQGQDKSFAKTRRLYLTTFKAARNDTTMLARIGYTGDRLDVIRRTLISFRPSGGVGTNRVEIPPEEAVYEAHKVIRAYANAIKDDADTAAKTLNAKKVPTIFDSGDPTKDLREAVATASLGDDFPEDFMSPPIFGNPDLLSVKTAEDIYNNLFGAKKVFSGEEGFKEVKITAASGSTARVLAVKKQAYTKFVNFAKSLNRVFPVLGSTSHDEGVEAGTSEWETRSAVDSDESVRDWVETKFLKRERLQSLGHFLKVNGLKLEKPNSEPPTQQKFLHFVPAKTFKLSSKSDVGLLTWDNTLFSKIVDEFQITKKTVKLRLVTGLVIDVPIGDDKEILRLRKSVKNPFLTTKARQAIILDYARRHHGSRGFGGS